MHHRTTVTLEASIERVLRRLALKERKSFKELINDLIKRGLKEYPLKASQSPSLEWHTIGGHPHPNFDPSNRSTYMDLISKPLL